MGGPWAASPASGDRARALLRSALSFQRVLSEADVELHAAHHPDATAAGGLSVGEGLPRTATQRPGSLVPNHPPAEGTGPVVQLGRNAHGECLEAGRVPDCYLGLLLEPADNGRGAAVLVVAPAALLDLSVRQPDGTVLYELLTGHPDRAPGQLVFLADLTVELRAWPTDTWAKVGVDPQTAADAVIAAWHRGHIRGLRVDGLTAEEAVAVERPAMTYLRAQLADRLDRRIAQACRSSRSERR